MHKLGVDNIQQFRKGGYTIIRNALSPEQIQLLIEEADTLINFVLDEGYDLATDIGCIIEPLTCGYLDPSKSNKYKTNRLHYQLRRNSIIENSTVSTFVLETVAKWAATLLGNPKQVYLMNEQYIVKPPHSGDNSRFEWHQDSDYLGPQLQNQSTVACWIALDPVDEFNGTIMLCDLREPHGEPVKVIVPAGSVVFMSNQLRHKSTGNKSSRFRRVFMPQYSLNPLASIEHDNKNEHEAIGLSIQCLFP
ncbi:hypothetical protein BDA99DRAFT_522886 [Phascolomyces articulosus]|uniref:Phytanoyl-CoA dioxygenase family protein n=1 Tax=Phascolomyces articulosus TaxID=60185 RepID=A0AAD5P9G9_9FUNG|nr:hypothetical protein BDA99DRAFT_522886 [Phascolomyces articulosus]